MVNAINKYLNCEITRDELRAYAEFLGGKDRSPGRGLSALSLLTDEIIKKLALPLSESYSDDELYEIRDILAGKKSFRREYEVTVTDKHLTDDDREYLAAANIIVGRAKNGVELSLDCHEIDIILEKVQKLTKRDLETVTGILELYLHSLILPICSEECETFETNLESIENRLSILRGERPARVLVSGKLGKLRLIAL